MWPKFMRCASVRFGLLPVFFLCLAPAAFSQNISGSTGSDGAISYTTPGTYSFDPAVLGLDPTGDGVFNFTTINIASGVTLVLNSAYHLNKPVYWLASGNVTISGTLVLDGGNGNAPTTVLSSLAPAAPGPGGYAGGVGGVIATGNTTLPPPQPGNGPGGGAVSTSPNANGGNGVFTGNQFLTPLIGGSGGSGGSYGATDGTIGGGGSAGGGALMIVSSTSITYGGVIRANGGLPGGVGTGYAGGGGSGGAIELVAPSISDAATGDSTCAPAGTHHGNIWAGANKNAINGNPGTIRLEASILNVETRCVGAGGGDPAVAANVFTSPNLVFTVVPSSQIWVSSVGGYAIGQGAFAYPLVFPDQVVSFSGPVTVNVAAMGIPMGTVPVIFVTSINTGNTQAFTCSPLSGTVGSSTCSASVTFPSGGSYGYVKATWGQ
jgi:hypothetical protein